MLGSSWTNYIAASLRNAGSETRQVFKKKSTMSSSSCSCHRAGCFGTTMRHDKGLSTFDGKGRCRTSLENIAEKERNRRRFLPSHLHRPGVSTWWCDRYAGSCVTGPREMTKWSKIFADSWEIALGSWALLFSMLDWRERKRRGWFGREDLGSPSRNVIRQVVLAIKTLARQYASGLGDPAFFRDLERAMEREGETIAKRRATTAARQITSS